MNYRVLAHYVKDCFNSSKDSETYNNQVSILVKALGGCYVHATWDEVQISSPEAKCTTGTTKMWNECNGQPGDLRNLDIPSQVKA